MAAQGPFRSTKDPLRVAKGSFDQKRDPNAKRMLADVAKGNFQAVEPCDADAVLFWTEEDSFWRKEHLLRAAQ